MEISNKELALIGDLLTHDIINMDMLEANTTMLYKKKVDEVHPYTISKPGKNTVKGFWRTRVYDESKTDKRRPIKAVSEKLLYKKLYAHYFETERLTLETFFNLWLAQRKLKGLRAKTIKRNVEHWNKYYLCNPIIKKPLKELDVDAIEDFFHKAIVEFKLTKHELNNMKIIMTDMLRLAVVKKLISYNPCKDMKIDTHACLPPKKRSDKEGIFNPDEQIRLFDALNRDLDMDPTTTDSYAIFLLFKLGLRIGEVVAIRQEDIDFENGEIHIHRMETTFEDDQHNYYVDVVDYTKKKSLHGDRYLQLSDYEISLLETVLQVNQNNHYFDDDFVFCDADGRTKCSEIDARLEKVCRWAGIKGKTSHTIRRTVATELYDLCNDIRLVKDFLGHSDVSTTWGYIYRSDNKKMVYNNLTTKMSKMNGLRGPKGSQ